jgi:hypothetical protein
MLVREALLLGAMLADEKLRATIDPQSFHDERFRNVATQLCKGKGTVNRKQMDVLLQSMGVLWEPPVKVLDAVNAAQSLAAMNERAMLAMRKEFCAILRPKGTVREQIEHVAKALGPELAEKYGLNDKQQSLGKSRTA